MLKSQKLATVNVTSVVDFDHSIESFVTVMAHCFRNIGITKELGFTITIGSVVKVKG
jgi:hypothetical protein